MGRSFASRVGASLLRAVGLPELITENLIDYENLVLNLAKNPEQLIALKNRLLTIRETCALFNTPRYVSNLEKAYQLMWQRAKQDLMPAPLTVFS
jgi:protein O-GlcNAc transferase